MSGLPPGSQYPAARAPRSVSGLGIASLVLGIIALVTCWVPICGLASVPVAIIGLLLGGIGLLVSITFRQSQAGMPIAGLTTCSLSLVVALAMTVLMSKAVDTAARRVPSTVSTRRGDTGSAGQLVVATPPASEERAIVKPLPQPRKSSPLAPKTPPVSTPVSADPPATPVGANPPAPASVPAAPTVKSSPEEAYLDARAKYDRVRADRLAVIEADPAYAALKKAQVDAQNKLEAARATGTPQERLDASSAFTKAKAAAEKYRLAAIANDRAIAQAEGDLQRARGAKEEAAERAAQAARQEAAAKAAADVAAARAAKRLGVTLAGYNAITEGMSGAEVWEILGPPSEELSSTTIGGVTTKMFMWKADKWGGNMNAMFQNGRLVSKAQFGLK